MKPHAVLMLAATLLLAADPEARFGSNGVSNSTTERMIPAFSRTA